ncbi:MAG TPA: formate dehydrogenase [Stellaceae bacterium]|nr:formate dehydrogenase [Stellaceae bacterium]
MSDRSDKPTAKRREFLKLVGLGSVAGAATLAAGRPAAADEPQAKTPGYRETEHIRKYYETARS